MSTKKVELSGAAADVIHALFFRGALQDGDLPSKAGTSELRELGFAETRHTATKFKEGDYFTFLTPGGAEYARQFLVETRFGAAKVASQNYTIGINVDASQAQRAINALDEKIRNSEAFKHLSVKFEAGMNTSIGCEQQQVMFLADRFIATCSDYSTEEIREAQEHIKRQRLVKRLSESLEELSPFTVDNGQVFIHEALINSGQLSFKTHKEGFEAIVKTAIEKQLKPGGSIWRMINER
jgi:hypothetical protein